jgi:hypothetical protein
MSEPLAERLSRFTPNATSLDRDTLLFAAGRASVRPSRRWQALAGVLAVSQLLTLVCLWPRTAPPLETPFAAAKSSRSETASEPPAEGDASKWRALRERMLETDLDNPATSSDEPTIPPDSPLRAFGNPPPSLLN